jgi:hypothetical protein
MNRGIVNLVCAMLPLALLVACDSTTQPDIPSISSAVVYGNVVDEDGLPVPQAEILLEHRPQGCSDMRNERETAATNESGFYRTVFALDSSIRATSCFVVLVIPPSERPLRFSPPIPFVVGFHPGPPRDSVQVDVMLTRTTAPLADHPGEIQLDSVGFRVELESRFLPPATPTSPFYSVFWVARNTSSRTIELEYCWLGIRLYRGSALVYEEPTFGQCALSDSTLLAPGSEQTINSEGGPQFVVEQGVPQGRLILTARFHLPGMADTLELLAGEVELIEHNGLAPAERPGTETALFVSGRSQTEAGEAVPGFVNVRIHWEDCGRFPVIQATTTTDVRGDFEQEMRWDEGIFDACISVQVTPYTSIPDTTVELGILRLREPDPSGFPRDSLKTEVVFE